MHNLACFSMVRPPEKRLTESGWILLRLAQLISSFNWLSANRHTPFENLGAYSGLETAYSGLNNKSA